MRSKFNCYLLSFCLMFICSSVFAQRTPPPPGPPPNPGLPIDGGLSYLLIAGVLYGAYEIRKKK